MAAYGLYTHIQSNRVRSIFLLIGLFVLVYVLTYAGALIAGVFLEPDQSYDWYMTRAMWDTKQAAPYVTVGTIAWVLIAYQFHQSMIDALTGGELVTRDQQPRLYNALENLCISRGLKTPTLRLIEDPDLNAFASGVHEGQFSITVTRGLLEELDRDELESVLGHELTHIINRDVRTMIIAAVFAGIISLVAQVIARMLWFRGGDRDDRRGGGVLVLVGFAAAAIAGVLAVVIRMAISRQREFIADAGSVELTKNPDAMISALQKVSGRAHLNAPEEVRGLFLENQEEGIWGLFATHPPMEARIAALVKFGGGRVMSPAPRPTVASDPQAPNDSGPWGSTPSGAPPAKGPWE